VSKIRTYIVARSMTDNGTDYGRGDNIRMSEADAAVLLGTGALIPAEDGSSASAEAEQEDSDDLDDKTVDQLKNLAEAEGADLNGATKKADIVAAIKQHRAAA
jgi:hypothetical protein